MDGTAPSAGGLETPRTVLGWYRFGPAPGAGTGSVVLAGHLDSKRYGLGPLVGLRQVEARDGVRVTRSDGTAKSYAVLDVRRHDRQALPEELFARTGSERLRIITCGGDYLPDAGGYQQNLVVTPCRADPRARDERPGHPTGSVDFELHQYDALLVDVAEQRLDYPQRTRPMEAQSNSAPGPSARRPGAHIPDAAHR